ncbi:MAG: acetamidase/formamidase family protein [Actinomycetota bacterium]|nr:acetamidase/formamidase family protein [Actinomycetota bacterium]
MSTRFLTAGTAVLLALSTQAAVAQQPSGGERQDQQAQPSQTSAAAQQGRAAPEQLIQKTKAVLEGHDLLQPLGDEPGQSSEAGLPEGGYYVPSTPDTVRWGYLPNAEAEPVLTVPSGSVVTFDTVSHEGILEDQGRDPARYFGQYGVASDQVMGDARAIAASDIEHDFAQDGPHIVTGPVAIEGAQPGDVLKVEVLELQPRVPYGVISSRHGKGALPGEFPENEGPDPGASAERPELFRNVSKFTPLEESNGQWYGILLNERGEEIRFPINPFMGIMGTAPDTTEGVHSVPPAEYGGNLDINDLVAGTTLYLPIQVAGALFYTGDPHFAQGDGEVALTALEAPIRATFRLTLLEAGDPAIPAARTLTQPFGETPEYWLPIGLNEDLDEAMEDAVRQGIRFLNEKLAVDRATALAYMSAATDFEVSQVVDRTKGVHALIRKADFPKTEGSQQ